MSWGLDDRQYLSLCDGGGFSRRSKRFFNSRLLSVSGEARDATFHEVPGYPLLGPPIQRPNDTRYYGFGTLAVDGYVYQFLSTFNRSLGVGDAKGTTDADPVRFVGVKLIYSPDNGLTWYNQNGSRPVIWEPWDQRSKENMTFFEEDQDAFSLLTILQMGRNYQCNRDGYVYVYAPNGNADGAMNELVMFRAPKTHGLIDRERYEFFSGMNSAGNATWSRDVNSRAVVHSFPRGWVNSMVHPYAWHPSVVYNGPLRVYMMLNWGMGCARDGTWFAKPSYLGLWIASEPWGPWIQVHEETAWRPAGDDNARAYQPQIAPKWIAQDGRSFWMVWTDFQEKDKAGFDRFLKERVGEKYWKGKLTDGEWTELLMRMEKNKPNYTFNVQRVDLIVA